MSFEATYTAQETTRQEVDQLSGPVLVEFGTNWCGFCQNLQPALKAAMDRYPGVRHVKVEDGPGLPLGRSFRVKLWPTFVFMRDGKVVSQVSRPAPDEIESGLASIASDPPGY